jgi:anti-anti-sigma regulatory factor
MEIVPTNASRRNEERTISSGGLLTVETISDFIQLLQKGLDDAATVVLEFDPTVEMDITALQVFCSACRTATAEGKKIVYRGPLPKALLDLLATAGAERHEQCNIDNKFCFRQSGGREKWES